MLRDFLEIDWVATETELTSAMPQDGLIRILLIDDHDPRRDTRERLLRNAGYEVVPADRADLDEGYLQEAAFDLVVVSIADSAAGVDAVAYIQRLRAAHAALPILALSDNGLYPPKESLTTVMQSAHPFELIAEVGKMLLESAHIRNNKKLKSTG
jgi:response regulator RpfG family c-di-GMP phosphodiesterase